MPVRSSTVIYIIKENRTYDQILGDMKEGNGDANLCLFGDKVTPNHHKLARQFVLLDNFYVDGEVSADGHQWSMGAYATDFVEKVWPQTYRGSPLKKLAKYPSEGNYDAIARPAGGYIWDRCAEAKVSYRSYGEWVDNGKTPGDPAKASVKALEGHIDEKFRGFDLDYPDQKRADRFIEELSRFEKEGDMPRLSILRLPNDHTAGTKPGKHHADGDGRRQRPGAGPCRRGGDEEQVLEGHGHFRAGRRCPERPRSRRCPPFAGAGHQSVHETRRRRFDDVFDEQHAADDGADSRPQADEPVRRRRDADGSPCFSRRPTRAVTSMWCRRSI